MYDVPSDDLLDVRWCIYKRRLATIGGRMQGGRISRG